MTVFSFNTQGLAETYQKKGYLHLENGVDPNFFQRVLQQAEALVADKGQMDEWTFANKKLQYLFEFQNAAELEAAKDILATATGLDRNRFTLCERHLKIYSDKAQASPPPHKDRQASKLTVGIPLKVPQNSFLQMYPHDVLDINCWGSSAEYRAGLDSKQLPETLLADVEPVTLDVQPGDVVLFRGSSIYHERQNPAGTWLLYLKFNDEGLDPIGEDYTSPPRRERSLDILASLNDTDLRNAQIEVSPRLDHVFRYYSRLNWRECLRAVIFAEQSIDITEFEFNLIRHLGAGMKVQQLIDTLGTLEAGSDETLKILRRLVQLQIMDLV